MNLENERQAIFEAICDCFGCDPAYYHADGWALVDCLIGHDIHKVKFLEAGKEKVSPQVVTDGDFTFEYGIVTYEPRFSIDRSLNDYKEVTLSKCIRIGLEHKYKTMAKDKLVTELQVLYKDDSGKLQCFCADLEEWHFVIKHKGDMMFTL